jgi:hypothetical protein
MSTYRSLALREIPRPDFADVHIMPIPEGVDLDPAEWANLIFDRGSSPRTGRVLMRLRQVLVPLLGLRPSSSAGVFAVDAVVDGEALISVDEPHLDFRCGVRVDDDLLVVTTTVLLHGRRGRLYFAPVSVVHGPLVQATMHGAIRRAVHGTRTGRRATGTTLS